MMFEMNKLAVSKFLKPVRNFFGHDMRMDVDALHGSMISTMIRIEMYLANLHDYHSVLTSYSFFHALGLSSVKLASTQFRLFAASPSCFGG